MGNSDTIFGPAFPGAFGLVLGTFAPGDVERLCGMRTRRTRAGASS